MVWLIEFSKICLKLNSTFQIFFMKSVKCSPSLLKKFLPLFFCENHVFFCKQVEVNFRKKAKIFTSVSIKRNQKSKK